MFGDRLRLARKRAGLSLRELAERIGNVVSAQAISKYESGKMFPSSSVLVALGRALDVSLDFLMSSRISPARRHLGGRPRPRTVRCDRRD